jgi:protein TonB
MLAYAAHRRAQRQLSPRVLTTIVGVHAVALGLLVTAKVDVGEKFTPVITRIFTVPPEAPPPEPLPPEPSPQPRITPRSKIDQPEPIVPAPPLPGPALDQTPAPPNAGPNIGQEMKPLPQPIPALPLPEPKPQPVVKSGPLLVTPPDRLRPPYPEAKRRLEEEAALRLRLSIDDRGRVVGVAPVGNADPQFLDAARTHLLRFWRYKPATVDGRGVPTEITITLRFQLDDE